MASIEALAMAGADYAECGVDLQDAWHDDDPEAAPPPYLLRSSLTIHQQPPADRRVPDGPPSDSRLAPSKEEEVTPVIDMVSIEALATAGADYAECGGDLDAWHDDDSDAPPPPPPYLLRSRITTEQPPADRERVADHHRPGQGSPPVTRSEYSGRAPPSKEEEIIIKRWLVAWAKAVVCQIVARENSREHDRSSST